MFQTGADYLKWQPATASTGGSSPLVYRAMGLCQLPASTPPGDVPCPEHPCTPVPRASVAAALAPSVQYASIRAGCASVQRRKPLVSAHINTLHVTCTWHLFAPGPCVPMCVPGAIRTPAQTPLSPACKARRLTSSMAAPPPFELTGCGKTGSPYRVDQAPW